MLTSFYSSVSDLELFLYMSCKRYGRRLRAFSFGSKVRIREPALFPKRSITDVETC